MQQLYLELYDCCFALKASNSNGTRWFSHECWKSFAETFWDREYFLRSGPLNPVRWWSPSKWLGESRLAQDHLGVRLVASQDQYVRSLSACTWSCCSRWGELTTQPKAHSMSDFCYEVSQAVEVFLRIFSGWGTARQFSRRPLFFWWKRESPQMKTIVSLSRKFRLVCGQKRTRATSFKDTGVKTKFPSGSQQAINRLCMWSQSGRVSKEPANEPEYSGTILLAHWTRNQWANENPSSSASLCIAISNPKDTHTHTRVSWSGCWASNNVLLCDETVRCNIVPNRRCSLDSTDRISDATRTLGMVVTPLSLFVRGKISDSHITAVLFNPQNVRKRALIWQKSYSRTERHC